MAPRGRSATWPRQGTRPGLVVPARELSIPFADILPKTWASPWNDGPTPLVDKLMDEREWVDSIFKSSLKQMDARNRASRA